MEGWGVIGGYVGGELGLWVREVVGAQWRDDA